MAKLKHVNLCDYAGTTEVYKAMQDHFNRDSWRQYWWRTVFLLSAACAIFMAQKPEWFFLFLGIYAAERSLAAFLDNSNRNWAMHLIDWEAAIRRERKDMDI